MATVQDTARVVALLNTGFRTPIDDRTWEWYVYGNPQGCSRVYLALDADETIVGVIGFAPLPLRLDGRHLKADYAHHLVLEPRYRETLSYIAILRHSLQGEAAENVDLIIGPPNRTAYPIHKTLMKWVDFGFLDCLRKLKPAVKSHPCRELGRFSADFDLFYRHVSKSLVFCVEKTAGWMNWRFFDRPGAPYTVYAANAGGEMTGYIVLKRWQDPDGYRKAHIIDLHAMNDETVMDLIAAAESYAAGCDELNLWSIQGYPYRTALESMGFAAYARQPLLARTFDGPPAQYPVGAASLSYGDGDTLY
jgi:hypothetical protein